MNSYDSFGLLEWVELLKAEGTRHAPPLAHSGRRGSLCKVGGWSSSRARLR